MASIINPFEFGPVTEYRRPQNVLDALKDVEPLLSRAAGTLKNYSEQEERRKMFNDTMAGDRKGYEWFDENDPAHKAIVENYIRTGDAGQLASQREIYSNRQDKIREAAEAKKAAADKEAIRVKERQEDIEERRKNRLEDQKRQDDMMAAARAERESASAAEASKSAQQALYNDRWAKAQYEFNNRLNEIENDKTPGFDKEKAIQELTDDFLVQGFNQSDVYGFLNGRNDMRNIVGQSVSKNTTPSNPKKKTSKWGNSDD